MYIYYILVYIYMYMKCIKTENVESSIETILSAMLYDYDEGLMWTILPAFEALNATEFLVVSKHK